MDAGSICSREVDTVRPDETAAVAAKRMLQRNVGSLIVVDEASRPLGILTDRDLTLRVLAHGQAPSTPVRNVMSGELQWVRESHLLDAALQKMRMVPCRRLPVVDEGDVLVGILTLDDIHAYHAESAAMMRAVLRRERPEAVDD